MQLIKKIEDLVRTGGHEFDLIVLNGRAHGYALEIYRRRGYQGDDGATLRVEVEDANDAATQRRVKALLAGPEADAGWLI